MGYNLMLQLIRIGKKSKEELTMYANVYFAAGQMTSEQYMEIMAIINAM